MSSLSNKLAIMCASKWFIETISISNPIASPLAKLTPVSKAPASPGPLVTAMPLISSFLIPDELIALSVKDRETDVSTKFCF